LLFYDDDDNDSGKGRDSEKGNEVDDDKNFLVRAREETPRAGREGRRR
jgi:hypothetical protein